GVRERAGAAGAADGTYSTVVEPRTVATRRWRSARSAAPSPRTTTPTSATAAMTPRRRIAHHASRGLGRPSAEVEERPVDLARGGRGRLRAEAAYQEWSLPGGASAVPVLPATGTGKPANTDAEVPPGAFAAR